MEDQISEFSIQQLRRRAFVVGGILSLCLTSLVTLFLFLEIAEIPNALLAISSHGGAAIGIGFTYWRYGTDSEGVVDRERGSSTLWYKSVVFGALVFAASLLAIGLLGLMLFVIFVGMEILGGGF